MPIPKLNSTQQNELIDQYVGLCVDSMDYKSMESFDEEILDELVDNVTQQYPKQLNSFGG